MDSLEISKEYVIANSEFRFRTTTSVVWWQDDLVDNYLANYQGLVKTIDMNVSLNQSIAFEQAILFVTSAKQFLQITMNLDKTIATPSKVIVILMNPNDLSDITETAWKYDIADLIILTPGNQSTAMYTYYPYKNFICGNTSPVKVDFKDNFFPKKFRNFFGCEIRLGSLPAPPYSKLECINGLSRFYKGLVGEMVRLIVEHINATLKVSCEMNSTNRSTKKLIENLQDKTINIQSVVILNQEWLVTLNTPTYHFYEFVWCGPPQREIYTYIKVLIPMMSNFTIFLGITYLMHVIALKIIAKIKLSKSSHIAWNSLATLLGQSTGSISKYWLINSLHALWFWFCLLVNIEYQGMLVKGLQTKYLEPRFDKIENALKLVDGYGGSTRSRNLYNGTLIYDKYQIKTIPEVLTYLSPISRGKRFLIMTERMLLLGYKSLQIFESVIHMPITMAMTPRWGAGLEISSVQTRLFEGGIWQKIYNGEQSTIEKREAKLYVSSDLKAGHLDFKTLSTCFFGFGVMSLVCLVIFLLELLYHRLIHTKGVLIQNVTSVTC